MRIFISYSRADAREFATQLSKQLREVGGFEVWIDSSIEVGESIPSNVRDQARKADVGLVILSTKLSQSTWCMLERQVMQEAGIPLFPILYSGAASDYRSLAAMEPLSSTSERSDFPKFFPDSGTSLIDLDDAARSLAEIEIIKEIRKNGLRTGSGRNAAAQAPSDLPDPKEPANSFSEWLVNVFGEGRGTAHARTKLKQALEGAGTLGSYVIALQHDPVDRVPYFPTFVKMLWRKELLNEEFFEWLKRQNLSGEQRRALQNLRTAYSGAFPRAAHISGDTDIRAGYLDRLLRVREFGMVLEPSDISEVGEDCFETLSGRLQKQFITTWELFDEREELTACMEGLASLVQHLQDSLYFSCLVTSTATGRHLVGYIHATLDERSMKATEDRSPIQVRYLSPELTLDADTGEVPELRFERVLLVTDVVASARLIRNLTQAVEAFGGEVVGAVSLLYIGEAEPAYKVRVPRSKDDPRPNTVAPFRFENFRAVKVELNELASRPTLSSLAHYPIPRIASAVGHRPIPVDPSTILPVQPERLGSATEPLFRDQGDTIEVLDRANALRFGLFRSEGRIITGALRFSQILDNTAELKSDIQQKLVKLTSGDSTLAELAERGSLTVVTTHRKTDMDFADFVRKSFRLADLCQSIHLPQREGTREPNPFVVMKSKAQLLRGRDIVLALGVIDSSDNLRAIVSLLATAGVKSIFVLGLLSRMRFYSANFLAGINHMRLQSPGERVIEISFKSVFELPEIEENLLQRALITLREVRFRYLKGGVSVGFRRLAENEFRRFEPLSLTAPSFEKRDSVLLDTILPPDKVPKGIHMHHDAALVSSLTTHDGYLFLLSRDIAAIRSQPNHSKLSFFDRGTPDRLVGHLCDNDYRFTETLAYHVFVLIIADLRYFNARPNGQNDLTAEETTHLNRVRTELKHSLEHHRKRKALESDPEEASRFEARYLFMLATLAAVDQHTTLVRQFYRDLVLQSLEGMLVANSASAATARLAPTATVDLANERLLLAISMLYRLRIAVAPPDEATAFRETVARFFHDRLRPAIHNEIRTRNQESRAVEPLYRTRVNCDALMTTLGVHSRRTKVGVIRHLHRALFGDARGYSGAEQMLGGLEQEFQTVFGAGFQPPPANGMPQYLRARDRQAAEQMLDSALLLCSELEQIAQSARDLFLFCGGLDMDSHSLESYDLESYAMQSRTNLETDYQQVDEEPGNLENAIGKMSELLYAIRRRHQIVASPTELARIGQMVDRIRKLLWAAPAIRTALLHFVTDLPNAFLEFAHAPVHQAQGERFGYPDPEGWSAVWTQPNHPAGGPYLLCDQYVFQDLLVEIIVGLSHELIELEPPKIFYNVQIRSLETRPVAGSAREEPTGDDLSTDLLPWIELEIELRSVHPSLLQYREVELSPALETGAGVKIHDHLAEIESYGGSLTLLQSGEPANGFKVRLTMRSRSAMVVERIRQ